MIVRAEVSVRNIDWDSRPTTYNGEAQRSSYAVRAKRFQEDLEVEINKAVAFLAERHGVRVREIRFAEGRPAPRKETTTSE